MKVVAWVMFLAGVVGFLLTFPMWLMGIINDRAMLGLTLCLSWAALWYEGANAIVLQRQEKGPLE